MEESNILPEDFTEAKGLLQNELISDQINICRIRLLCKENPGLIASVAGLRLRIWSLLLLGIDPSAYDLKVKCISSSASDELEMPCQEQQVLEADVRRTRADIEDFRSHLWRKSITEILQGFCLKHNIQYKQGMNEVLAPFVYLYHPTVQQSSKLAFNLFEAFIFRYLERYFCLDDSSFLFKAFRMFHLLLLYHDPQLALHLHDNGFPPELYSPQWFLTLYSRGLPLTHVMGLWDTLISIDDPAFTFFVGLCLLRRIRRELLLADVDSIPEIFKNLHFHGEEDVNAILASALKLFQATPRSFCRNLRLCCVGASEMHEGQGNISAFIIEPRDDRSNRNVAIQAVRQCAMISPQELVTFLSPTGASILSSCRSADAFDASIATISHENPNLAVQFVLIDIRSSTDIEVSGGGVIPRAIPLDPEFIDQPDAFDRWLQHFDGTRGCNICIIDLPPGQSNAISLWRRLILGEGDGTPVHINYGAMLSGGLQKTFPNTAGVSNYQNIATGSGSTVAPRRDKESRHIHDEDNVLEEEKISASIRLAAALQRASFPFISVLDGGFPALLHYLMKLRGTVEPIVIQHDPERWSEFLKSTGRESYSLSCTNVRTKIGSALTKTPVSPKILSDRIEPDIKHPQEFKIWQRKSAKDLSSVELFQKGYEVAVKMGHQHTATVLATKLKEIQTGPKEE